MVGAQPGGTFLYVDAALPAMGAQLLLEHRVPVNGVQNELAMRANALMTALLAEGQLDVDLRVMVFTVGAGLGYNDTFRGLVFRPDEPIDRAHRRKRDFAGDNTELGIWYGEARFNLSVPFNDYVVFLNLNTFRFEDRPDRSFDWRQGIVHEGFYFKSDVYLFLKHRAAGAIAPLVQFYDLELDGKMRTMFNYGFFFLTRPGLRRRDDILLFTMLFNFGKTFGNYDAKAVYGAHSFHAPITFLLAYRMVFDLGSD
jgi:hypothetical protein